jgi:hypothetical protein
MGALPFCDIIGFAILWRQGRGVKHYRKSAAKNLPAVLIMAFNPKAKAIT